GGTTEPSNCPFTRRLPLPARPPGCRLSLSWGAVTNSPHPWPGTRERNTPAGKNTLFSSLDRPGAAGPVTPGPPQRPIHGPPPCPTDYLIRRRQRHRRRSPRPPGQLGFEGTGWVQGLRDAGAVGLPILGALSGQDGQVRAQPVTQGIF